ncbi:hypothetical protein [Microbacterium oxydans]|uniref:Uncharacterized protein n=1 Tax=Microbacterium oxydans TaxID=82380 RepID=A0A0F0L739_9MICO|nr:hypothetical protein [Microbacterium oxydans]KJL28125.1 hypothetical protein RS83_03191 [Microbacterium oxydans]
MPPLSPFSVVARVPSGRGGALIAALSLAYAVVVAPVAFYLLPVGFELTGAALIAGQLGVIGAGAVLVLFSAARILRDARRRARLVELAHAAGWDYRQDVSDWIWGGSVDEQIERTGRSSRDHIDARGSDLPFDSAERTVVVGDREGATVHTIRAVRIPLSAEAPRITLRSRRGGGALSLLPRRPSGRSELRLEGNFSDVFEVSVPAGYETDALYLLTPDLMVILLDASADLDLEIVDSTLHVYFPAIDLTDPAVLARVLGAIAALHERFGRRTLLYRDERAPALDPAVSRRNGDTLAAAARTLDTRLRIGPIVLAVLTPLIPMLIAFAWLHLAG